jgi:hypothetical protein
MGDVQANWDGATRTDREEYDHPARTEAARFLTTAMNPNPRIDGITTVEHCQHWLAVATDQDPVDQAVIAALNRRIAILREQTTTDEDE